MLIAICWVFAVAIAFLLIVRPWRPPRIMAPVVLAAIAAAWVLWLGALIYADLIERQSWTAATITIAYVPLKALFYALLGYGTLRAVLRAGAATPERRRWQLTAAGLVAICLVLGIQEGRSAVDFFHDRMARSTHLTVAEIDAIQERITSGRAGEAEITTFLANPLCPVSLLQTFAAREPKFRMAVGRNGALSTGLIVQLSRDTDAYVRLYAVYNPVLPSEELPRLAADPDPMVREAMAWKADLPDQDFARLVNDPVPRVRAAAALQSRVSLEDLRRLASDSDDAVQRAAARKLAERGGESP